MWNRRWLFWTDKFKQWPKNRWYKVIIVINNSYIRHFNLGVIYEEILFFNLFLHSCLSIPVIEFRSLQAWRLSRKLINACVRGAVRALVSHFKRKRTWRSWHHDLESIRHDLESLCSDNDRRCHMRKVKIISLDWIALLRRLLMIYNDVWCVLFNYRLINCVFIFASEFRQNNARALRFWCVKCTNPKGECIGQASKFKRKCIILSKFSSTK